MTYLLICVPFLLVSAIVAVVAQRRIEPGARARRTIALAVGAGILLVLTAVFDTVMIAAGLFGYAEGTRLGATIGLAPVEDFAYPIAAVLLVPAVWTLMTTRRGAARLRAASPADDHTEGGAQ
ncbi:lycopene cyclase domain-containing protein [Agromyces aureus]|uniref:lycopene cyclase domain-containing protein n=1 Tax=Agromyces aureus TaxID=453304 RepID=UPI00082AA244|nr:lycopene cyclase domain-containing protein [Agromyces aureus]